jgi:indolepyruvate ferredoxin oxidoreductase
MERELIGWYRDLIAQVIEQATDENLARALEIAALPEQIRGYEKIKEASIAQTRKRAAQLLNDLPQALKLALLPK